MGVRDGTADDAGGDRPGAHAVEDPQRRQPVGTHDHVGIGMCARRRSPASRQARCRGSSRASTSPARRRARGRGGEPVHRPQHRPRLVEQSLAGRASASPAGWCVRRAAGRATPRVRRSAARAVASSCAGAPRPAEVTFLGDGDEVPQPPEVRRAHHERYRLRHDPCPRRSWTSSPWRRPRWQQ